MKGCVVERAKPSNCIDLFPLIKSAAKEGLFYGKPPGEKTMKDYYYRLLLQELPNPAHFFYLAKRSRGYLGCLHAILVPDRWDGSIKTFWVDFAFVVDKRRQMGVGKKLIEQFKKDAEEMGIKNFEFLCPEDQVDRWSKKLGAQKKSVLMRAEHGAV